MVQRCTNPDHKNFKDYGGRGIDVCDQWRDGVGDLNGYECYAQYVGIHLGPKPGPGYSVDRIDNDRSYEPGNLRWATQSVQRRNQRPPVSKRFTVAAIREIWLATGSHRAIAERFGISKSQVGQIKLGKTWAHLGLGVAPRTDTVARGERHAQARLSDAQVRRIHRAQGLHRSVAERFGVSKTLVGLIKRGRVWRHLGLAPQTKKQSRQG
jgi:hypothetical protein